MKIDKMITLKSKAKGIVFLKINNPPVNALSLSLVQALNETLELKVIRDASVLVFSSKGNGFSAGADLKERSIMTDEESLATVDSYCNLFNKIESLKYPTISRIHGYALGGGLELSLACDFRFATKATLLGFPETNIGIIPGAGGTQRLPQLIGLSKAKEWIFLAQKFSAKKGLEDKVLNAVFDCKEDMDKYLEKFCADIVNNCDVAISAAKKSINSSNDIINGSNIERKEYIKTFDSEVRRKKLERYRK